MNSSDSLFKSLKVRFSFSNPLNIAVFYHSEMDGFGSIYSAYCVQHDASNDAYLFKWEVSLLVGNRSHVRKSRCITFLGVSSNDPMQQQDAITRNARIRFVNVLEVKIIFLSARSFDAMAFYPRFQGLSRCSPWSTHQLRSTYFSFWMLWAGSVLNLGPNKMKFCRIWMF